MRPIVFEARVDADGGSAAVFEMAALAARGESPRQATTANESSTTAASRRYIRVMASDDGGRDARVLRATDET